MANKIGPKELGELQKILQKVDNLIAHTEELLLETTKVQSPSPSDFNQNPDSTFDDILTTQQVLSRLGNTHTRVQIEDSRLWGFSRALQKEFGVVETEAITKQVNFYSKRLKDMSAILSERKKDLTQVITSVRSVQSNYTERFKATRGN